MTTKKLRQQFADTMLEVGQRDPRLTVLIGDISHFILQPFAKACPGRFYNIGICEPTIISMAAGLAKAGLCPVVHTIAPFILERSFEQIKLDFCYQKLPGNIITVGSAFDYSNLGCTHHCYGDFALIKSLPNTQIVYPASAIEFEILFKETYGNAQLTVFRLPEYQHGQAIEPSRIKFGKSIKIREGRDLTFIAAGPQLKNAVVAAEQLSSAGWSIEIIYIPTIHPLDLPVIRQSIQKTKRAIVIEEHNIHGGVCDDVLRGVMDIPGAKVVGLGIKGFIRAYGTYEDLCAGAGLSVEGILREVGESFKGEIIHAC